MQKRGMWIANIACGLILLILLVSNIVIAQETDEAASESQPATDTDTKEVPEDEQIYGDIEDVEFDAGAGLTPDSPLYFLDDFVEQVFIGDSPERALAYKEEKVAEAREMIEEGKAEEAKEALDKAREYGDILEKEVSPEIEKEARESSKAVTELFDEIEADLEDGDLEGEEWDEVKEKIGDQKEQEKDIALAAKISSKIKSLCKSLSELDPVEFERVCNVDDDSPRWQKRLHKELTEEQRDETEQFFEVMSQCFENPRKCRCNDISIKPFAEKCSEVAPLAAECDEGDEKACEEMDSRTEGIEDLLPDYLQEVMAEIEDRFSESQFDLHMPRECQEANAKNPKECMKIMFRANAPPECQEALESGKISFENEREAREECERIMFEENAPEECVEAGLRDHKECGRFMFKLNAPQECIDAGLTGERASDGKKCGEIMKNLDKERGGERGQGHGFGRDCRSIEDSKERLDCYDKMASGRFEEGREFEEERKGPQGGWPPPCEEANALTRESCEKVMRDFGENNRRDNEEMEKDRKDRFEDDRRRFEDERRDYEREGFRDDYRREFPQGMPPPGEGFPPPSDGERREDREKVDEPREEPSEPSKESGEGDHSSGSEGGSSGGESSG